MPDDDQSGGLTSSGQPPQQEPAAGGCLRIFLWTLAISVGLILLLFGACVLALSGASWP